jgi:signal transduction histidine kinase
MKLPGPLNSEQDKQLTTVRSSARHLLALINDLLDVTRIEAGQLDLSLEPCDCGQMIEEVVAALAPTADAKGLLLAAALPPDPLVLTTDLRALRQILINLVNNALKFTERGSVHVTAARRSDAGRNTVRIAVQDSGIGIPLEDRAAAFAPFSRLITPLSRVTEGTGLGLHLSRTLAAALGGAIELESEVGRGSTFTLVLPDA